MKSLLLLLLGIFIGFSSCMILIPLFQTNYKPIADVVKMIEQLSPYKKQVEIMLLKKTQTGQLIRNTETFSPIKHKELDYFRIMKEDGSFIFRLTKDKQIIILTPYVNKGEVVWKCIGAPSHQVPLFCR